MDYNHTSNKTAEFLAPERGLIVANEVGYSKLHIERESQLVIWVISTVKTLLSRTPTK